MSEHGPQIGRLALRVEGGFWNAYYAQQGTMTDAILLASIRMQYVQTPERKRAFMDLMRECVADTIEEIVGVRPEWGGEEPAAEHERAGSA